MKLYTEKQVRRMIVKAWTPSHFGGFLYNEEQLIKSESPIELPSDEYIDEVFQPMTELHQYYKDGFINGAKWMKEQILNQNK